MPDLKALDVDSLKESMVREAERGIQNITSRLDETVAGIEQAGRPCAGRHAEEQQ